MKILAIETSCDETAASVVQDGTKIISNVVASSTAMHKKYGGIVPEVAAREQLRSIIPVITESLQPFFQTNSTLLHRSVESQSQWMKKTILKSIDAIAVTVGPGLIGSLLVGVETAKTIAFVTGKPIIPVNHVIAHMYANFLDSNRENSSRANLRDNLIEFPAISLVVSGGHTELYLMKSVKNLTWLGGTLDDAAGECFDKTARLLGFGHGGGLAIQEAASRHSGKRVSERVQNPKKMLDKTSMILPRPMINDESLNFSFSGLKTAVMREWKKLDNPDLAPAFAYEIQEAITDVLVKKTLRAAKLHNAKSILLSGGVASNLRLREKFNIQHSTFNIHAPEVRLCTDNAVMIASCAYFLDSPTAWHEITAIPDLSVER